MSISGGADPAPRGAFERVMHGMAVLAAVLLAAMALSVVYEVVLRYAFGRPTSWAVDFSEYALLWCLFLSTAWVLWRDAHIRIDIFLTLVPAPLARRLSVVANVLGSLASLIFFVVAVIVTWEAYRDAEVIWRGTIVKKWLIWIVMPIGSLVLTIEFIRRTIRGIRS